MKKGFRILKFKKDKPIFEVKDLTKSYDGRPILKKVSQFSFLLIKSIPLKKLFKMTLFIFKLHFSKVFFKFLYSLLFIKMKECS